MGSAGTRMLTRPAAILFCFGFSLGLVVLKLYTGIFTYSDVQPLLPQTVAAGTVDHPHPLDRAGGNSSTSNYVANGNITNRTIYYVHTGKTGGTTLYRVLRACCDWFRNPRQKRKCSNEFNRFNESRLSKITKTHHHTSTRPTNHEWLPKSTSFLFTVRNPIDRAVSAFDMGHPKNTNETNEAVLSRTVVFYDECFPDAEVLAMTLAKKNHTVVNSWKQYCYAVGHNTLIGKGHIMHASHLLENYESYVSKTSGKYPEREVFVARTEYLWEDLGALNLALGGSSNFTEHVGVKHTHGSEGYKVKSKLSALGRATFCCHLHEENRLYEQLLQSAVNLPAHEKTKSLHILYKDCGISLIQYQNASFSWKEWAWRR